MPNMEHYVIPALLGYILVREIIFIYSTHKLVNKLMSRDYYSYKMSETVGKKEEPTKPAFKDDDAAMAEDLHTIFS